jgi:hypothetical protein
MYLFDLNLETMEMWPPSHAEDSDVTLSHLQMYHRIDTNDVVLDGFAFVYVDMQ